MTAFTTISDNLDVLAIPGPIEEVVTALKERSNVGALTVADPVEDDDGTIVAAVGGGFDWSKFGIALRDSASRFADHDADPEGEADVPMLTEDLLFERAEIADGFRGAIAFDPDVDDWTDYADPIFAGRYRKTWPGYDGEILGPWILADVQAMVSALRRTTKSGSVEVPDPDGAPDVAVATVSGLWTGREHIAMCYLRDAGTGLLTLFETIGASSDASHTTTGTFDPADYDSCEWVLRWDFTKSNAGGY